MDTDRYLARRQLEFRSLGRVLSDVAHSGKICPPSVAAKNSRCYQTCHHAADCTRRLGLVPGKQFGARPVLFKLHDRTKRNSRRFELFPGPNDQLCGILDGRFDCRYSPV